MRWPSKLYPTLRNGQRSCTSSNAYHHRLTDETTAPQTLNGGSMKFKAGKDGRGREWRTSPHNFAMPPSGHQDGWANMPSFSALTGVPSKVSSESIPTHVASLHTTNFPRQEKNPCPRAGSNSCCSNFCRSKGVINSSKNSLAYYPFNRFPVFKHSHVE